MGVTYNLILGGGASLPTTLNATVSGGTATAVTASLGSRSVSLEYVPGTSRLPSGYTELEYIESSGTQYIDTGFIPNFQTAKVELNNFTPLSYEEWLCFFGVCETDSSSDYTHFWLRWLATTGIIGSLIGNWSSSPHANYQYSNPAGTKINSLSLDKDGLIVNGSLAQYIWTGTRSASSRNLFIFGCNKAGSFWRGSSMRCGNVKCYTSDVLQRDFIPARRNSDSVLGMYDLVNDVFYTNAGSGSFTAGPEVETPGYWSATLPKNATGNWTVTATDGSKTVSDLVAISGPGIWSMELKLSNVPSGYTELEYIESSGTQYIDTGYTPNGNTKVVSEVMLLNGVTWEAIFGSQQIQFAVLRCNNTATLCSDLFGTEDTTNTISIQTNQKMTVSLDAVNITLSVDSATKTVGYSTTMPTRSMWLFAKINAYGTMDIQGSYQRHYRDTIYSSGELVRDFIPARRNSDSVLGMYDTVNDVFYTNAGSGTFIAGPDV